MAENTCGSASLTLHHKTDRTADPREFISRMASGGSLSEVTSEISSLNSQVSNLIEMHEFYPILHYFRFKKSYYALPRVMMILLDTASLLKTAPDADRHRAVAESLAVQELWASATHLMERLAASFLPKGYDPENPDISEKMVGAWSAHYRDLLRRLSEEGIDTADPSEAGEQAYISLRRRWHPYVEAFTSSMKKVAVAAIIRSRAK
ncbi:MAG: hypothetical protein ACOC3A_05495 [Thermodesulfobacteriota bacterium]